MKNNTKCSKCGKHQPFGYNEEKCYHCNIESQNKVLETHHKKNTLTTKLKTGKESATRWTPSLILTTPPRAYTLAQWAIITNEVTN